MKTLAIVLLLASSPAFAFVGKNLHCKQNGSEMDNGYEALVTRDLKKAFVSEQTISGPDSVAELACQATGATSPGGDQIVTIASCGEPEKRDDGYSLRVQSGGIAGLTTATLSSVSIAGEKVVAEMTCRYLNTSR